MSINKFSHTRLSFLSKGELSSARVFFSQDTLKEGTQRSEEGNKSLRNNKLRSNKVLERYDFHEGYVLVNLLCCFISISV